MQKLFDKLLVFNNKNEPCKFIKNDGIVCYCEIIKDFEWIKEDLKNEFTVVFIDNKNELVTLSSNEIKDILSNGEG
jgi:hypothetical protein